MRKILLCLVFGFGVLASNANAWSRNGHMIIAAMAYRAIPAELQAAYTDLLRHHPDYNTWVQMHQNLSVEIELGEFLFMRASVWPDEIRRRGSVYDHPTWHYTNFPLKLPGFPVEETLTPENDVIFAVQESRRMLNNPEASDVDKAAFLSWILHTVGDLHQPLHCVAFVSDRYPDGDRGGNLFYVRPSEQSIGINLHGYWDGLLGTSGDTREARNDATLLWRMHGDQQSAKIGRDFDVRSWVLEGRQIAIDNVYLNGMLTGTLQENRNSAEVLPETYSSRAKSIAQERAVVASLRLLHVLTDI